MTILKNIFAVIGLFAVLFLVWFVFKFEPIYQAFQEFDDKALDTYLEMGNKLLEHGNAADATVWKVKVNPELTVDDVEEVMTSVANELNIKNVGTLPLSKQVEAMTGEKQRFLTIYMYCNPLTAIQMVDYSDAFSAYLPCRITLLEDKSGQLWIYALNMDMMIYGGKPLPKELYDESMRVKNVIVAIMERAATGEF